MEDTLIPVSRLAVEGWEPPAGVDVARHIRDLGEDVELDDLGREAIRREALGRLIAMQRDAERRAQALAAQRAAENDAELERRRLAQLAPGLPSHLIPDGLSPAMAMIARGERGTRRPSVFEDLLEQELAR